ncbi:glycoside hydrolase family 88 protein [Metabacillus sp. KIGAM252]|uniref:Glycoside hydrolase family 88 protein n=1 Tax=Metabacillus flavus TaxID=2823519 RepID=A0ABS5LGL6_9BACI|nr:glycoside hydrolase family 88 protein [Metabacillus flavus]MBS2969648.1 glycoside hydrolase family 88 protein [Metabacillus flavus]
MIILGFVLSIVLIILLIDLIPLLSDWTGRIKIGKIKEEEKWNQKVTGIGAKWLNHTPKIKVTDNTRLIVLDMLKGNYLKNTIQHWQEASLLLGLTESLKNEKNEKIIKEINKYLERKFDSNGLWKEKPIHVDGAILAYAIMKLENVNPDEYKPSLDYIWELIQEHIEEDGTVGYRKTMKGYKYVDTIGFICPFLVAYGMKYQKQDCVNLAIRQIREYVEYGLHEKFTIPLHAYKVDDKVPLGLLGWGRGLGWFALGITDTLYELTNTHKHYTELENIVMKFCYRALSFQQANGSWNWTVTRNESRPDSSATAAIGWLMANAGNLDESFLVSANKASEYLKSVTRRNGAIDFSQGDTKDIGVYSNLFNILPFTQGLAIRLSSKRKLRKQCEIYDEKGA